MQTEIRLPAKGRSAANRSSSRRRIGILRRTQSIFCRPSAASAGRARMFGCMAVSRWPIRIVRLLGTLGAAHGAGYLSWSALTTGSEDDEDIQARVACRGSRVRRAGDRADACAELCAGPPLRGYEEDRSHG